MAAHKAKNTTAGIDQLNTYISIAPSSAAAETAAAKLSLGNLYTAVKDRSKAEGVFKELTQIPPGVNDDAKGEAALRMAYLTSGRQRAVWAERIVAKQFKVDDTLLAEAHALAAGAAQKRGDLRRAIELHESSPGIEIHSPKRAYHVKELAGLYFERAKGEGDDPAAKENRAALWESARAHCQEAMNGDPVKFADSHRMVAELMHMETYWFQGDHQKVRELGGDFFARWGTDSFAKTKHNQRQYINTALTLKMQNDYILGKFTEAEALARQFIEKRPEKRDEFANSNSLLLSLVTAKLSAKERGDTDAAARYAEQAAAYETHYEILERSLQSKRQTHLEAAQ